MTPDEHVAAAEALALDADELLRTAAGGSLAERMQAAETARAMAAVGRLLVDLSVVRQTRRDLSDWEQISTGLGLAPVADVTPIKKTPAVGDTKDCEHCATTLFAMTKGGALTWLEWATSNLHSCPPPEPMRAPADDATGAPDQHPRKDHS